VHGEDDAARVLEVLLGAVVEEDHRARLVELADDLREALRVLRVLNELEVGLERLLARLLDARLVHARAVEVAEELRVGLVLAFALGVLLQDLVEGLLVLFAHDREAAHPARLFGRDRVGLDPAVARVAEEVLAGAHLRVDRGHVHAGRALDDLALRSGLGHGARHRRRRRRREGRGGRAARGGEEERDREGGERRERALHGGRSRPFSRLAQAHVRLRRARTTDPPRSPAPRSSTYASFSGGRGVGIRRNAPFSGFRNAEGPKNAPFSAFWNAEGPRNAPFFVLRNVRERRNAHFFVSGMPENKEMRKYRDF
jgi:hypothetical protein